VLVTGASGFTGSCLSRKLLDKGFKVRILVRGTSDFKDLQGRGCEVVIGDLATGDGVEESVRDINYVYHIASVVRIEGVPEKYFWDVNVEGTRKLLDASLKFGVKRFIHCSTVGVQGEIQNPPAREDAPFRPDDHYQKSKLDGEKLALSYTKKGLGVVVFRPVGIYGPGDLRFLKLFRPVSKGRWFTVGRADNLYHMTYIDDLVDGILLCGTTEGIEGEVFTLAGETYGTVKELGLAIAGVLGRKVKIYHIPVAPVWIASYLCEKICRFLKIEPPLYRRRLDFFLKDRAFNISKAKKMLGFSPMTSLEEGIRKTATWYRSKGMIE